MNNELLIIFIKNPVLGKAKTRLAATIGAEKALEVYQLLLNRTQEITQPLSCDKTLYYADFIDRDDNWTATKFEKQLQAGTDLGERMLNAFLTAFKEKYQKVCIIGSDCYELSSGIIQNAFEKLEENDVVIGPSTDGGYYLLGMTKLFPAFFKNKNWSTNSVLAETLEDAKCLNLTVALLPTLTDVDEEKDLTSIPDFSIN